MLISSLGRAGLAALPARAIIVSILAAAPAAGQFGGPVLVGVTEARQASVRPTVALTGTVVSRRTAVVASEVPGLVVALEAREGQTVRRGAVLVRLRRENLTRRLDAARAQLREATARRDLAVGSRGRAEKLFADGVISSQEYAASVSEAEAWQGRVDQAEADIARLADDLERSTVRAPFTGVVVAEHCQIGEWIAVGGPTVELLDLSTLEVALDVPEQHFAGLRTGVPARTRIPALPALGDVVGEIGAVIPRADPRARTFPVKVRLANPDGEIGVGMLASVALPTGAPRPAVVVPKDAVVSQGERRLVYVVEPAAPGSGGPGAGNGAGGGGGGGGEASETVRPVDVELGAGVGEWIEARGVEAGARVVTRGNERLMPGAAVRAEPISYPDP